MDKRLKRLVSGIFIFFMTVSAVAAQAQGAVLEPPEGALLRVSGGKLADQGRMLDRLLRPDAALYETVSSARAMPEPLRVHYVQERFGRLDTLRFDEEERQWARPSETLRQRGGISDDLAILKLAALHALGIERDRLALLIGYDTLRGRHAVAAVRMDDGWRILDDDLHVRRELPPRFATRYSLAGGQAFLHGRRLAGTPGGAKAGSGAR